MNEIWDKLALQLSEKIAQCVMAFISPALEKFFRGGVELVFTEEEAAALLKVSAHTLALWRKNDQISHYSYTKSATYGLHHLADFIERHEHKNLPPLFAIKREIAVWGTASQAARSGQGVKTNV